MAEGMSQTVPPTERGRSGNDGGAHQSSVGKREKGRAREGRTGQQMKVRESEGGKKKRKVDICREM